MSRPLPQQIDAGLVVIDASMHVVGRLASEVAKLLRRRRDVRVVIINAEKAVITGNRGMVLRWYTRKVSEWRTHYNPEKVGPKVPRRPDRILKRVIRDMLEYKTGKGRGALKRLRVYMSVPSGIPRESYYIPEALLRPRPMYKYVTLEEIWSHVDPDAWRRWKEAQNLKNVNR
ncbi:MAG: 50S ribosomal protein L13 [Thermoproteus sp.]|nr:50S ribosomal protein L13 [Thermoproteus sp.]